MRHLSVRNVPDDLGEALQAEKTRRGTSLNQTVLDLLAQGLGIRENGPRSNGLRRLAGTWTDTDKALFDDATALFESIDEEVWR